MKPLGTVGASVGAGVGGDVGDSLGDAVRLGEGLGVCLMDGSTLAVAAAVAVDEGVGEISP